MKKGIGLILLTIINGSGLYLIYWYICIACSIKVVNILNISYEPSGMQLFFYILSFPFFLLLALLSTLHSYYFDLKKSLSISFIIIWFCYFALIFFIDLVVHFSTGNGLLYYGSLCISVVAICHVLYSTYSQIIQLTHPQNGN